MTSPIDYTSAFANVPSPVDAFANSFKFGAGIRQVQQQQEAQEAAALREQQKREALARYLTSPDSSAKDAGALVLQYPELREPFKDVWKMQTDEQRKNLNRFTWQVMSANGNGRSDLAEKMLRERAQAIRDSSGSEEEAAQMDFWADRIKENPEGTQKIGAMMLAAEDPENFAKTFSELMSEQREQQLFPAKKTEAGGNARQAVAEAESAEVKAKYADEEARAGLKKLAADLRLTESQINQAFALTRKYNAETTKAAIEAATGDPGKRFELEQKLRKEYTDGTKVFTDVTESFRRVKAAQDNAVGDMSMIFGYMKMLDPTSVVREGEQATASNARGVPDTVMNLYNRVLTGERLTPGQRKQFVSQAKDLFEAAERREQEVRGGLSKVAEKYSLDKENIFGGKVQEQNSNAGPAANNAKRPPLDSFNR